MTSSKCVIGSRRCGRLIQPAALSQRKGANTVVLEKLPFSRRKYNGFRRGFNAAIEADYKKAGVKDSPQLHTEQTLAAGDNRTQIRVGKDTL